MIDGTPVYYNMKAVRANTHDDHNIVLGISNIDDQMKEAFANEKVMKAPFIKDREYEAALRNTLSYSEIAQALSQDYFAIYYVDIITNEFLEFKSAIQGSQPDMTERKEDFFKVFRETLFDTVVEEDRKMIISAWDKDALLNTLQKDNVVSLTCRMVIDDRPQYVNIKVFQMVNGDGHHIVTGISNIDAQMKKEEEYAQAQQMALRDPLTGVKNKRSYTQTEKNVNDRIRQGQMEPFSVVICDLNDLKAINDTRGHTAGDDYIKEACMVICHIFDHSPVFRIGGDEFAVLLTGRDYNNRSKLFSQLAAANQKNIISGEAIMASGISDFDPDKDKDLATVFQRADSAMYINKKVLKGIR